LLNLYYYFYLCYLTEIATELATNRQVAIKKIKVRQLKDGLDVSALREIKALQELRHPNILEVS
jgi:cyclin-dependent kinase 7